MLPQGIFMSPTARVWTQPRTMRIRCNMQLSARSIFRTVHCSASLCIFTPARYAHFCSCSMPRSGDWSVLSDYDQAFINI
mmetsp:Transcript_23517/g.65670  ORF Transcript_23517/g.65670 Transcript_23517/m.65670 type:complete len:80 (-) Transcript_23517:88-327(-)